MIPGYSHSKINTSESCDESLGVALKAKAERAPFVLTAVKLPTTNNGLDVEVLSPYGNKRGYLPTGCSD